MQHGTDEPSEPVRRPATVQRGVGRAGLEEVGAGLCAAFMGALPITGAALSAFSGSRQETTLFASDELAARLDELQFDLGEGRGGRLPGRGRRSCSRTYVP